MTNDREYMDYLRDASDLLLTDRLDEAIDQCTKAIAVQPDGPEALCMLGIVAFQLGDGGRAITLLERAHSRAPDCRDYADALAVVNARAGRVTESLYFAKLAVALEPHGELTALIPDGFRNYRAALDSASPSAHFVNAAIHFEARQFEAAVESCGMEVRINERNAPCYRLLGRSLAMLGDFDQAASAFHAAVHIEPAEASAYLYLGNALAGLGLFDEARACHRRAAVLAPGNVDLRTKALAALSHFSEGEWRKFADESASLRNLVFAGVEPVDTAARPATDEEARVRIGYLSDRLWDSPQSHFIEAVMKSHDRDRFVVYGYQQNVFHDLTTTRFKSCCDEWREIFDVDDDTAANIIARDGIDILVDHCSYVDGQRLGVFARRPAPVQVGWLSWPQGSGLGVFDFVVSDPHTVDGDRELAGDAECVVVEPGLLAIEAERGGLDLDRVGDSPVQENGFITFGGVCDLTRITPAVVETWARALHAMPGSRVLLGYADNISPAVSARTRELFSHFGLVDRVFLQASPSDEVVNLTFFSQVDVMLDTFPVSGTMEICEALLMGIPVVTMAGERRSAQIGASILRAAGKPEWVVDSEDGFVEAAVSLAGDQEGLAGMRSSLGEEVAKSALCDCQGFARAIEGAYEQMLEKKKS